MWSLDKVYYTYASTIENMNVVFRQGLLDYSFTLALYKIQYNIAFYIIYIYIYWRYSSLIFFSFIFLGCLTSQHDVLVFVNDKLAMRSNGLIATLDSQIDIYDCNDHKIYISRTGSFWITLVNSNRIFSSFQLQDLTGNTLAYVETTNYFSIQTRYYGGPMGGRWVIFINYILYFYFIILKLLQAIFSKK